MLVVHVPNTYISERTYIVNTLLSYFLGVDIQIAAEARNDVLIDNVSGKKLIINDVLFQTPDYGWLTEKSLPEQPLDIWNTIDVLPEGLLVSGELPILYGGKIKRNNSDLGYLLENQDEIHIGIDIFGSAFFMLTRYEEYVKDDRDQHDRFPAKASLAYQEGFLDRPIVNEYIEILWWCMKRLWPGLERKQRQFRMVLSHDVDSPFAQAFIGISRLIRNCGGDIIRRKSFPMAINRFNSWQAVKKGIYKQDFNYTFDRIMDISEQHNLKSAFYFKTACTNKTYDDNYSIDHPYIRQLIRDIHTRGHEIGLHPSYETYQNSEQTKREFQKLIQVCDEENINQDQWGGRQHYLRWNVPVTWQNWENVGLNYDSTLSYADYAGFRCGICYEYPVYDIEQHKQLDLIERPLIVMEGSVMGEQYMNLEIYEASHYISILKTRCKNFKGDFTLLWHNSSFTISRTWKMYQEVIGQL